MFRVSASLAAVIAATAAPALAELTAEEVWADLQAVSAAQGLTGLTATLSRNGDLVVASGITARLDFPDPEIDDTLIMSMSDITLRENGDGTVSVILTPDARITLAAEDEDEGQVTLRLTPGDLSVSASGDAEATRFDMTGSLVTLALEAVDLDDAMPLPGTVTMTVGGLEGGYVLTDPVTAGGPLSAEGGYTAARISGDAMVSDGPLDLEMTFGVEGVSADVSGALFSLNSGEALGPLLAAGLVGRRSTGYDAATITVANADPRQGFDVEITTGASEWDTTLGSGGLSYDGTTSDIGISGTSRMLPIPGAALGIAALRSTLEIPLAVSEEPQPFALVTAIDGLTVDEALWSMFDPTGTIPRDPAQLRLDISGQGNFLVDITDPTLGTRPMAGMPGQLHALSLEALLVSVAGAELTGSGAVAFDNSAGPLPRPDGAIDLRLVGLTGLMERLGALGLLPEEQAMGMQMMLGLFATPAPEPDTLTSTIEFRPDGAVYANGQRIR